MTSTHKYGTISDQNIQTYKDHDPMCEPGLISIMMVSCGRHPLTRSTLDSTFKASKLFVSGEIEWLFLEQGDGEGAEKNLSLFNSFPAQRKIVIRPNRNYGINNAFNTLWGVSRGEYCFVLENDWLNRRPDIDCFGIAKSILDYNPDVALVQLRAAFDPNENWGFSKPEYSPWTSKSRDLERMRVLLEDRTVGPDGHRFLVSNLPNGFNNNPNLIRKTVYRECGPYPEPPLFADLRHGETEYQERYARKNFYTAHIGKEVYYHIGGSQLKEFSE